MITTLTYTHIYYPPCIHFLEIFLSTLGLQSSKQVEKMDGSLSQYFAPFHYGMHAPISPISNTPLSARALNTLSQCTRRSCVTATLMHVSRLSGTSSSPNIGPCGPHATSRGPSWVKIKGLKELKNASLLGMTFLEETPGAPSPPTQATESVCSPPKTPKVAAAMVQQMEAILARDHSGRGCQIPSGMLSFTVTIGGVSLRFDSLLTRRID